MPPVSTLIARSSALLSRDTSSNMSTTMIDLLIALMVMVFVSLLLIAALYAIRKVRRSRAVSRQQLPQYNEKTMNHRSLKITTSNAQRSSIYVYDEKSSLSSPASPPLSPENVPEIRITFPDEHDESGRPMSGRVVIVRVGETGVGLEPLNDEQLPAYEKESHERFHSIDMERIGGLKEKSSWA
jgi:hypothetical protein